MHLLQGINKRQKARYRPSANGGFVVLVGSDVLTLGRQLCFLQGPNQAIQKQQSDSWGRLFLSHISMPWENVNVSSDLDYFCLCSAD